MRFGWSFALPITFYLNPFGHPVKAIPGEKNCDARMDGHMHGWTDRRDGGNSDVDRTKYITHFYWK